MLAMLKSVSACAKSPESKHVDNAVSKSAQSTLKHSGCTSSVCEPRTSVSAREKRSTPESVRRIEWHICSSSRDGRAASVYRLVSSTLNDALIRCFVSSSAEYDMVPLESS